MKRTLTITGFLAAAFIMIGAVGSPVFRPGGASGSLQYNDHGKFGGFSSTDSLSGMSPGATYYIQAREDLQSGATFYVSSGTVRGIFTIGAQPSTSFGHEDSEMTFNLSNNTFGDIHRIDIRRLGNSVPAQLLLRNLGNDLSNYKFWKLGANSAATSLEVGDQTSTYLRSGSGSGNGETLVTSAGTGVTGLVNNGALTVVGTASLLASILNTYSSDGSGGLTQRFSVEHDSVRAYVPLVHMSLTLAEISATTPPSAGSSVYCSDCTTDTICVSTGTSASQWARISARTTPCQ